MGTGGTDGTDGTDGSGDGRDDRAPDGPPRCVWIDLDVAGRAFAQLPTVGVARGLALPRARAEVGLGAGGGVQARLAVIAARSGGEAGYVGIDGEAIVPAIQIAEARYDWRRTGIAVAAGLVDDVWVMTTQPAWARVDLLPPLPTEAGFFDRSDVGGWASWTASGGIVTATAAATSGEGARRRERNGGTNLTGVIHLRPLIGVDERPIELTIAAFGREGSRGVGQAPDHRAGGAVLADHRWFAAGIEGVVGWGLRGDGTLRPAGLSAWGRTASAAPVVAAARLDRRSDDRRVVGAGQTTTLVAGGVPLPPRGADRPGYLVVGWQGRTFGPAARTLAGAEATEGADLFFLQLGARLFAIGGIR